MQDYLPIQGSVVASEQVFSSSGITSTERQNHLNPETFEAIQLLKHGYKTNTISATMEIHEHKHAENEEEVFWADCEWEEDE